MFSIRLTFATLIAASVTLAAPALAMTLYVSPQGNDAWSGSAAARNAAGSDGPLKTLAGARDAIRRLKAGRDLKESVTVKIEPGTYQLSAPLELGPEDSGTGAFSITYEGDAANPPILSGGHRITDLKQDGPLWVTTGPAAPLDQPAFGALWVNGHHRTLARTPNAGYFHIVGSAAPIVDPKTGKQDSRSNTAFRFRTGDIQNWPDLNDVLVIVYHNWETSIHRIKSVDLATNTVEFTGPAPWAFASGERFVVENAPGSLDAPGEWRVDPQTHRLSYMPMRGENMKTASVVAPVATQLLLLNGNPAQGQVIRNVRFNNLKFYYTNQPIGPEGHADGQAEFSIPAAAQFTGAIGCSIERCEFAHLSNYAVWFRTGCQQDRIFHSNLHDLGAGGIRIGEGGSPAGPAEAVYANDVDDNFIHDTGTMFQGSVGVWIGRSSYNVVSHNDIGEMDYTGVSVGWLWGYQPSTANHNLITYNHIHDIGRGVMSDMGAIYTLGISPGTEERGNVMNDIYCYPQGYGGWGVYTDEGSSDILVENNLVYNTSSGCFHQHYGENNTLQNNIFAYGIEGILRRTREETHNSFTLEHNIVVSNGSPFQITTWADGHYTIDNNLYWNYEDPAPKFFGMTFADWQSKGRDTHSVIADPRFAAHPPAGQPVFIGAVPGDFTLQPGSPALKIGFKPFSYAGAGLYGESKWVSLPAKEDTYHYVAAPPPPPAPIAEGFEQTPVGQPADGATTNEEGKGDTIRVTDETAATGVHSLKFVDQPNLAHDYDPHLFYSTDWKQGMLQEDLDLKVEPGAVIYHEWRDNDNPYHVGPAFYIDAAGQLSAGGKPVVKIAPGQWMHVRIRSGLGKEANGRFDFTVTLPGASPLELHGLPCSSDFHTLNWFGFSMNGNKHAVVYLDNLQLRPVK